jgi:hypothetical protein
MLEYLSTLKEKNITVHALEERVWDDALAHANRYMEDYLRKWPHIEYYVVTDPDVALLRSSPDILLFLAGLLASCPELKVVGPHLQISDLPSHYTGKTSGRTVFQWEKSFWLREVPNMATFKGLGFHHNDAPIDTTFAMRRRTQAFARLTCPCARTHAPYAAVHLDWYHNSSNLPADKQYYLQHGHGGVNTW